MYNAWLTDPLGFHSAFGGFATWSDFLTSLGQGAAGQTQTGTGAAGVIGGTIGSTLGNILGTNTPAPTTQLAATTAPAPSTVQRAATISLPLVLGAAAIYFLLIRKKR